MKITWNTLQINYNYEDSLPKIFCYLDWSSGADTPLYRIQPSVVRLRGERIFQDITYHYWFSFRFGIGKYGLECTIKYKPHRLVPIEYHEWTDISKTKKTRTMYSKEYL